MNKMVQQMDLRTKIGQLFMVGFDATSLNDHIIELIRTYKIGNVVLFGRNIKSVEQVFTLTQELQKLAMKEIGHPLFIAIDQEGGMVTRIKEGSTFFPGAMTLSASNKIDNAFKTGSYMGEELKYLGINMDFAPSLDVNNNPHNPVIGVRSFGDDPKLVSDFGTAFIKGLQEHIIATAKHFPGHGDTQVDSHLDLPQINIDAKRFKEVELKPFLKAIENGVKAIMSAHINFPLITEEGRPVTLSKNALTNLLRNDLGFKGLIVTDCMQMKAIQSKYTTGIGSKLAVMAGADIILVSHDQYYQVEAYNKVLDAVESGEIREDVINEHVERILQFKKDLYIPDGSFSTYKEKIIVPEHKTFAKKVVKEAVTLVRGTLPDIDKKTLLIAGNPSATTIADEESGNTDIIQAIKKNNIKIDTFRIELNISENERLILLEKAKQYEQIIVCSYNANIHSSQIDLMDSLSAVNKNTFVFVMRNPYDDFFSKNTTNFINFYEYTPNSIQAAIALLKGELIPQGKNPVHNG
jgi:beta-N-acetylhexosaminidase